MVFRPSICDHCTKAIATGEYLPLLHCCKCDEYFEGTEVYNVHILLHIWGAQGRGNPPSAPFACADCELDYYDEKGFNNHLKQHEMNQYGLRQQGSTANISTYKQKLRSRNNGVKTSPAIKDPNIKNDVIRICKDCGRDFASNKARKRHKCPNRYPCIGKKCRRTFKSLTGLTDHLESGACKSGYNREKISRLLCKRDTQGLITVPGAQKLLEAHYSSPSPPVVIDDLDSAMENLSLSSWGVLTPTSNRSEKSYEWIANEGVPLDNSDVISLASGDTFSDATPKSSGSSILISEPVKINPRQCQICFKIFKKVGHLQQHVQSAAHAPKIYHCQLSLLGLQPREPIKQFKTLSGLVSHVENGSCRGGMAAFDVAINMMGQLAREFGFSGSTDTQKRLTAVAANKR
ncbi:hypothetical protein TWF506_000060 [Arthrobotrys conoides]|uniref:C2H2-type domain-containing protein n=1 Tax=Arthrobotrys conoides TaxID=74498 RepID=A0AAN8PQC8_9PEZI